MMSDPVSVPCHEAFKRCIVTLRLGMEAQFNVEFVGVLNCIQESLSLNEPDKYQRINQAVMDMYQAQADKDYIRLADVLEYELLPHL